MESLGLSRLRGELLRSLIIIGLAFHKTAPELPRMPVPPVTVCSYLARGYPQIYGTCFVDRYRLFIRGT